MWWRCFAKRVEGVEGVERRVEDPLRHASHATSPGGPGEESLGFETAGASSTIATKTASSGAFRFGLE